ncbi:MAG: hypothetical protein FD167_1091 [bacterium]|nr:MAG: hypothetical protein FD167_1091 [bacterium]
MEKCWAKSLGDCDRGLSLEHFVSKNLFPDGKVTVAGFNWLKGEHKTLPINSVAANVLCVKHNNDLSELDTAIKQFSNIVKNIEAREAVLKSVGAFGLKTNEYTVDGNIIERWLAKSVIGLFCGAANQEPSKVWQDNGQDRYYPPKQVVDAIYGKTKFKSPMGLYLLENLPTEIKINTDIGISILHCEEDEKVKGVVGGVFNLNNVTFLIWLSPLPIKTFNDQHQIFERGNQMWYRSKDICYTANQMLTSVIHLSYSS